MVYDGKILSQLNSWAQSSELVNQFYRLKEALD